MHRLLYIILIVLTFAACSTTENIPEGEQLYLGIKGIRYADSRHPAADAKNTAADGTTDETGVITAIADAYDTVHDLIDGSVTGSADIHALKEKKRSELTKEEKAQLAIHEQAEAAALAVTKEEIEAALAYEPNGSLFGSSTYTNPFKFGLWVYNHYANSSSRFGRWMFRKFGEQPVLISHVAPQTRAKIATNTLRNYGYFRAGVDYTIVESKNPLAARVAYNVTTGPVFHLDSIERRSFGASADSLLAASKLRPILKTGNAFSVVDLAAEQTQISDIMRENGYYYWSAPYTTFQADTLAVPGYVQLRVLPKVGIPAEALRPWYIGKTQITIRDFNNSPLDHERTSRRGSMTFLWSGNTMPAKARLWRTAISHRHNQLFRQSDQNSTITKLAAMGILSSVDVTYTPHDTTALCDTLDVYINATMGRPYDSSFEMNATLKSSQQVGPGVRYELAKRNAFHGGETVSWDIFGSYEWQLGRRHSAGNGLLNSFELGSSLNFEVPRFAFPFISRRRLRFPATTTFSLEADWRNRSGFFQLLNFGTSVAYNWTKGRLKHEWDLMDIDYYRLNHTSEAFDEIVEANPAVYASMRNIFVPSMSYSLTFAPTAKATNPYWFQWTLKEAGNLTQGIHALAYPHHDSTQPRHLLGTRYAQFVKTTFEAHYTHPLSPRFTFASRFFTGVIFNYGNSDSAPYSEQFYIGGANSVRAFTVRTAGPGSYRTTNSKYAYVDQTGDFKLEANAELRARLVGNLHGAVFLDAGNVWLLRKDALRPGAELTGHNLRSIALGTGVGLRYDLEFLVLRFDVGMGLHAPYSSSTDDPTKSSRSGFYNFQRFRDGVAYHFAIGYPF